MNDPDLNLFLISDSHPYLIAAENTFIGPELPHLQSVFSSVTIIPKTLGGEKVPVADEIVVDVSLAKKLKSSSTVSIFKCTLLALTSPLFYHEILKKPRITSHPKSIMKNILFLGKALIIKKWMQKNIEDNRINLKKSLFYTYWLNEATFGICLLKTKYPDLIIISRAHRTDIYENSHDPPYIPYRPESFKFLNKIYADSKEGKRYLQEMYPEFNTIITESLMGVSRQDFVSQPSDDGIFRIVSCSYLVPVKRVGLLIQGLAEAGCLRDTQIFEWTHIGDGPQHSQLKDIAENILPANVRYQFLGYLPADRMIDYYKNHNIDVFINVSASEGTPVSIMEAQSCSIPVVATSVGGNSEIVSDENGYLLRANPTPAEIAEKISSMIDNPSILKEKKIKSRQNWALKYNSEKNFQAFSDELASIIKNNNY